jgi:beta-glucosidase
MTRRDFIGLNLAAAAAVSIEPWPILAQSAVKDSSAPWMDASLPSAERARLLAAAMTPTEQAGQLLNYDGGKSIDWLAAHQVGSFLNRQGSTLAGLACELRKRHRLHVPVLFALDCIHGHGLAEDLGGTIFPSPLAMAASFDPEQARRMGRVTADEMVAAGLRWTYAPNIDVAHDLRFGRIEETLGEDTFIWWERWGRQSSKGCKAIQFIRA